MGMDSTVWERHANPLSVYTRIPILMLMVLAIWSHVWIGWWCLLPIIALAVWAFVNPRAFPPLKRTTNWASRGVMGERVWLNDKDVPIPSHHAAWAGWLALASGLSVIPMIWGLIVLDPFAAFLGGLLTTLFKVWFVDRMVWLYEDMKDADPSYRTWLRE